MVQIACGEYHTAALTANGEVLTWGKSVNGQLGHSEDSKKAVTSPTLVDGLKSEQVARIACGGAHTVALTVNGDVWQWGDPVAGQLGLVTSGAIRFPQKITELSGKGIASIECGSFHTAAISAKGELYTWGHGGEGRLGHGDETNHTKPKLVQGLAGKPVTQVACGRFHTAAAIGGDGPQLAAPTTVAASKAAGYTAGPNATSAQQVADSDYTVPGAARGRATPSRGTPSRGSNNVTPQQAAQMAAAGIPVQMATGGGKGAAPRGGKGGLSRDQVASYEAEQAAYAGAAQAQAAAMQAEMMQKQMEDQMVFGRPMGSPNSRPASPRSNRSSTKPTRSAIWRWPVVRAARHECPWLRAARRTGRAGARVPLGPGGRARALAGPEEGRVRGLLGGAEQLQEVDKWRKEKEALDMALKNVTDNFAASASMAEGHRQLENDLEDRLKEAIDSSTKGNPKALKGDELRKQLEFTTQELEKERLSREAAEKTCRDLRKELMSAKEEVDRMWEELHTTRETQSKIVRDLEEQLAKAIEERDTSMERATKAQEERLRHFEEIVMEKARQEREGVGRGHGDSSFAHAVAEKVTSSPDGPPDHRSGEGPRAKEEQDARGRVRTQVLEAQAQRESILKSMGDLETSLAASKMEREEQAAVARNEKETLGAILRDLEEQLEAKLVRMEITDQTRADKDVLSRALENLENRLNSMADEKSQVQASAKEDIQRMTKALREKEAEIVALEKAKRAVEKQLTDTRLELSSIKVGYDTMSKELASSEMRGEQQGERLDDLQRREKSSSSTSKTWSTSSRSASRWSRRSRATARARFAA